MKAFVGFSCGRCYLDVGGVVVAMEGDPCRDPVVVAELEGTERPFTARPWTKKRLMDALTKINEAEP